MCLLAHMHTNSLSHPHTHTCTRPAGVGRGDWRAAAGWQQQQRRSSAAAEPCVYKLHGDMPQSQRTANFLRFTQVCVCVCVCVWLCACVRACMAASVPCAPHKFSFSDGGYTLT